MLSQLGIAADRLLEMKQKLSPAKSLIPWIPGQAAKGSINKEWGLIVNGSIPRSWISVHEDQAFFREAVLFTAGQTGLNATLIEKDYFCTILLQYLYYQAGQPAHLPGRHLHRQGLYRFLPAQRRPRFHDFDATGSEHFRATETNGADEGMGEENFRGDEHSDPP